MQFLHVLQKVAYATYNDKACFSHTRQHNKLGHRDLA